jgi:hypothetical protein
LGVRTCGTCMLSKYVKPCGVQAKWGTKRHPKLDGGGVPSLSPLKIWNLRVQLVKALVSRTLRRFTPPSHPPQTLLCYGPPTYNLWHGILKCYLVMVHVRLPLLLALSASYQFNNIITRGVSQCGLVIYIKSILMQKKNHENSKYLAMQKKNHENSKYLAMQK